MTTKVPRHRWTNVEVALLRELYPHTRAQEIADRIGATANQVFEKAFRLGIKKSRDAIARAEVERATNKTATGTGTKSITQLPGATITRHTMR